MKDLLSQGDIIKIEGITPLVLVASKEFFNASGEIIGCPIFSVGESGPLHIFIKTDSVSGYVQCEKLALFDINVRGHRKVDRIKINDVINIADTIQGIFDYI